MKYFGLATSVLLDDYLTISSLLKDMNITTCQVSSLDKIKMSLPVNESKELSTHSKITENLVCHAMLRTNFASSVPRTRTFSRNLLISEIRRCAAANVKYLVIHPGSNPDKELGIKLLADSIDKAIDTVKSYNITNIPYICVENMAGQGSMVVNFADDFNFLYSFIKNKDLVAVCLDTAHLHGFGKSVKEFIDLLDENFPIKVVHFNNSQVKFGSHKDRHELLDKGFISLEELKEDYNLLQNVDMFIIESIAETNEDLQKEISTFNVIRDSVN